MNTKRHLNNEDGFEETDDLKDPEVPEMGTENSDFDNTGTEETEEVPEEE